MPIQNISASKEQVAPPVQSSGEAQPKHERPPAHNPYAEYAGYTDYVPTIEADPYTQEYRGPQQMENYTPEVSSSQQMEGYTPEVNGSQQQQTSERAHTEEGSRQGESLHESAVRWLQSEPSCSNSRAWFSCSNLAQRAFPFSSLSPSTPFLWLDFCHWYRCLALCHEMGHAVMMKLKGIPVGGLIFIPCLVLPLHEQMPKNVRDEAEVAIAGPIAGALAASFCLLLAQSHGGPSNLGATGLLWLLHQSV